MKTRTTTGKTVKMRSDLYGQLVEIAKLNDMRVIELANIAVEQFVSTKEIERIVERRIRMTDKEPKIGPLSSTVPAAVPAVLPGEKKCPPGKRGKRAVNS